jgi:hypothetical protein
MIHQDRWPSRGLRKQVLVAIVLFTAIGLMSAEDREIPRKCRALHAGIVAQLEPMYTESPRVHLALVLLNDSDAPIDVEAVTWAVVIDGKETRDPWMSSVGPGPNGGYHTLNPGEHYEIGLSLDDSQFSVGDHKFSWKGAGFQSPTVILKISR